MYTSHNVLEQRPHLVVSPELACALKNSDAAIALQQIHYWLSKECGKVIDGTRWIYNTYAQWLEQFPWLSEWKLRKIFYRLRELKILKFEQHDRKKWNQRGYYTIDYEELEAWHRSICGELSYRSDGNLPLDPEAAHTSIGTENTPEISAKNTPTNGGGVEKAAEEVKSHEHDIPSSTEPKYSCSSLPQEIQEDSFSADEDMARCGELGSPLYRDDELKNNDENFNSKKSIKFPSEEELKNNRVDLHSQELRSVAKKFPDRLHTAVSAWLQWAKSKNVHSTTRSLITAIKENWQPQLSPREQWWHAATIAWGRSKRDRLIVGVMDGWIYFKNGQHLALDKAVGMSWDELASLGGAS